MAFGENRENMGGWWVATNAPVAVGDDHADSTGAASYAGFGGRHLCEAKRRDVWDQRIATGDMTMGWNFGSRTGDLKIKDFGHSDLGFKTFEGGMSAPGYVDFGGVITSRKAMAILTALV